jgi:hypothetical protein
MGFFKSKSKGQANSLAGTPESNIATNGENARKKKFGIFKGSKKSKNNNAKGNSGKGTINVDRASNSPGNVTPKTLQSEARQGACPIDVDGFPIDNNESYDLGDIPKSISTDQQHVISKLFPNRVGGEEQRGDYEVGEVDFDLDSLDSPCSVMRRKQLQIKTEEVCSGEKKGDNINNGSKEEVNIHNPPSLKHLDQYISALSPETSPHPSSDTSSRALRSLFSLSEHASSCEDRITMVRYTCSNTKTTSEVTSLVSALLSFLKRCTKDSSEQYLTLLVLNNISIPNENKRLIAIEYGGAKTLGRLLCTDPGCHLLVIILVNLTFCDVDVRRDLICCSGTSVKVGLKGVGKKKYLSSGGDVQLVDALAYALLVSTGVGSAYVVVLYQALNRNTRMFVSFISKVDIPND